MNIGKITANIVPIINNEAKGSKLAQTITVQNPILQKLSGLDALANQKMPFIKTNQSINEEELKLINLIKQKVGFRFDEFPSDNTLAFIAKNFIDKNANLHSEIRSLGMVINKFLEMPSSKVDAILNSDFISLLMKTSDTKSFKFSCLDIPAEKLISFDTLTKNPLTKAFSESFFTKNSSSYADISDIIDEFQKAVEPVENFCKMDKSDIFYDILQIKDSDDITELAQILQNKITSLDDKEAQKLHSLLKTLLEAKTPEGKFIFGTNQLGDATSKGMLSGIENILNSKENDKEKFEILMNLLQLTKQGKIPPSVLGTLAQKGEINPAFIEEVNKLQKGINSISQFKTKADAIKQSKLGDVVQIQNQLFYRNQDDLTKINLDLETFNELFPKIETMSISQGQLGDCYLISAINDFMSSPKGREKIYQMFEVDGNDIIVTIPDAKEFPIRFVDKAIEKDGKRNVNASKGIQMLEDAYMQTRALKYGTSNSMTSIAGGNQFNVYNAFLGKLDTNCYMTGSNPIKTKAEIESKIEQISAAIKEQEGQIKHLEDSKTLVSHIEYMKDQHYIDQLNELQAMQRSLHEYLEQAELYKTVDDDKIIDKLLEYASNPNYIVSTGTKMDGDWLDKTKLIHCGHAYSIMDVNKNAKTINVVNPWNTAQYTTLTFDEFKNYFDTINVAKLA